MAQQQRPSDQERYEQERYERSQENGLASEMKKGARSLERQYTYSSSTTQGYVLIAAGTVLLLFSIGLFIPILQWVVGAAAVAMIALGLYRSDVLGSVSHSIENMRHRR
jgi:hypothetical protein